MPHEEYIRELNHMLREDAEAICTLGQVARIWSGVAGQLQLQTPPPQDYAAHRSGKKSAQPHTPQ